MYPFYGSRPGNSFVIITTFRSQKDMIDNFKKGPAYTAVHYDEYVLINETDPTDQDNGKIYRRGYDFNNEKGGAEYIGKVVGARTAGTSIAKAIKTVKNLGNKIKIQYDDQTFKIMDAANFDNLLKINKWYGIGQVDQNGMINFILPLQQTYIEDDSKIVVKKGKIRFDNNSIEDLELNGKNTAASKSITGINVCAGPVKKISLAESPQFCNFAIVDLELELINNG